MYNFRTLFATLAALALLPAAGFAQNGTISGRVTDAATGQGLGNAVVQVQGTSRRAATNVQGQYSINEVPAGQYTVTATQIGREAGSRQVTVVAGQTQTVNFALGTTTIALEGLVATATGEDKRQREVGNAVGSINVAEDVELASVNDVAQVLQGRTAGVSVLESGGTVGGGARIRIRGSNSVSLSNDPLLIIDGIRVDNNTTSSIGVGGQDTNRLNDINPENIENIDVLKGPAASALYGTAAANGVIVITTKKGRAGTTRFNAYTEQGTIENYADFPANFEAETADGDFCLISLDGPCANIISFNPLEDSRSSPFQTGHRQKYGANVSGGNELATYFLSGEYEDNGGIYDFDLNTLERKNLRANIRGQLLDNLDITVSTGYVNSDVRLPQNDNNILGIVSGALLGNTQFDSTSFGFGFGLKPEDISAIATHQVVERITGSTTANWRPIAWLSLTGTAGVDRVNRFDNETIPPGRVFFSSLPEGERTSNRAQISTYTANGNATANYQLLENVTGSTSVGAQYNQDIFRQTQAFGARLLAGVGSLEGTTARFGVGESNSETVLIGGYVQQQFGWNDRVFLTGAVRGDKNSAFGTDFGAAYYPAVSASWVISEEPWFIPNQSTLSNLRLRAAYGQSGLRPGQLDALTFLNPVPIIVDNVEVPGFTVGGTGNEELRPEKSREYEVGFDAGFFQERVGLEFTYYNKRSSDALIARRLPPSLGLTTTQFVNLGAVANSGFETLLSANIVEQPKFRWDATLTYSTTNNELEDLGKDPITGEDIAPIIFGLGANSQRHAEGLPLGGYYGQDFTFSDDNGDGIIQPDELEVADTLSFQGDAFPTREASFQTNATFFNVVKLSGLLDYRGGYKNFNSTEEFRCGAFLICEALFNADASLEDQAAAVATAFFNVPTGYFEDAAFLKLRELSLSFMVPEDVASRFGTDALSLTLSGRNLGTWTDYKGVDPEINFAGSGSNFSTAEFLTQPPVRFFTARLDVSF